MVQVTSAAYAAAGTELLSRVREGWTIPYVRGGSSEAGMDCQGVCEYLLMQCGVPKVECDLAGSNAHWRNCIWRGTPEECVARFGCVPDGAWIFIVDEDGAGTPEKYRGDGLGDAGHMGIYLGNGIALHASASRGCVAESSFKEKTIPNGGWNAIGLPPWVNYGLDGVVADTAGTDTDTENEVVGSGEGNEVTVGGLTAGTPADGHAVYATVSSPDGNPVKLRKSASQKESMYYWLVNDGARVRVERVKGDWSLVAAICTDGYQRRAYMMNAFLKRQS